MVTVTVLAILAAVAAPSFSALVKSTRISSAVNVFLGDLRYARSEAVRRGTSIVLCRSDNPEATAPRCGTSLNGPNGDGWISGWIIFVDLDDNRQFGSADELLRIRAPLRGIETMIQEGGSWRMIFTAAGRFRSAAGAATLKVGPEQPPERQRIVCVDSMGRGRVAGDGLTGDCG